MLYSRLHGAYFISNHRKRNSAACPGSITKSNSKCWSRVHNRDIRPGCGKKAFNILWQNHIKFGNVMIRIGVFHTICSLFGALGKHMKGSGFEEIVIEAGVCANGSLQKVMSGKHYNPILRVHKLVLEALERLLFEVFQAQDQSGEGLSDESENGLRKRTEKPASEQFQSLITSQDFKNLFDQYETFKNSVRNGSLGRTAQFWPVYMDVIWLNLCFIRATKGNNFELVLHLTALYELCPLFFTYNHYNYSRYMPAYLVTMLHLSDTHPGALKLLKSNVFSVSRSTVPLSRNPVDITIEQTINRHAKSHGGIIGFSRNYSAYYRWCVTAHFRAKYVEATLNMADMTTTETSVQKELKSSQIKSSEEGVTNVKDAVVGFTNPFTVENKKELYCLSSSSPVSSEVSSSLLQAKGQGQSAMD